MPKAIAPQGGFLWPSLNFQNRKVRMNVEAKQRAVIEFLLLERYAGEEIAIRLRNVCGLAACCHALVLRWISEIRRGNEELRNEGRPGRPYRHETNAAIQSILQEDPNPSLRTIAETLSILPETVRIQMSRIGHTLKTLRWIPHALACEVCFALLSFSFSFSHLYIFLFSYFHISYCHIVIL
jgi:hypothetical protein